MPWLRIIKESISKLCKLITSNDDFIGKPGPIKVFDLNGKKIKEINTSNNTTYDSILILHYYYDKKLNKNYIITGNYYCIKSYDYDKNKNYHEYGYKDSSNNTENGYKDIIQYYKEYYKNHIGIIIYKEGEITKLIDSCINGYIRMWNFHSGEFLKDINCNDPHNFPDKLFGICLVNNNYLIVGSEHKIKIIDLNKNIIAEEISSLNNYIVTIKKIIHPLYGECIITHGTQGDTNDKIKLWKLK